MPGDQFDADVLDTAVTRNSVLDALTNQPDLSREMISAVETYFDDEESAVELEYLLATGTVV